MLNRWNWIVPAVILAGVLAWSYGLVRADDKPAATGTVSGTVVDQSGNPVPNAKVKVMPKGAHKHDPSATQPSPSSQPSDNPAPHPQPLAQATTDANGAFTLTLPAGDYVLRVGSKGAGHGKAPATVTEGQETKVTITLKAPKNN